MPETTITLPPDASNHAKFDNDYLFNDETLPNATSKTSTESRAFGNNQARLELCVKANDAVSTAAGQTITVSILQSDDNITFGDELVIKTVPASTDIAAGEVFAKYVPNTDIKTWMKVKVLTTEDHSAKTMDAYLRYLP